MIICKPYGATFMRPDTCIAKQTELAEILKKNKEIDKRETGAGNSEIIKNSYPVRYFALQKCHGCKIGLELYKKFLKEKPMNSGPEVKKCPCGATITRYEKQKGVSWRRVKYCEKCAAMSQYQREKFLKGLEKEPVEVAKLVPAPKKVEPAPTPKKDPDFLPEKKEPAEVEIKTCIVCGKDYPDTLEFFQTGKKDNGELDPLCKPCRNKRRRESRAKRKQAFVIDIFAFPELMPALAAVAEKNLRTPENQALWMLKEALGVVAA